MTREADRQIIDAYHTVTRQLLDGQHQTIDLVRALLPHCDLSSDIKAYVDDAMKAIGDIVLDCNARMKSIVDAQARNVRDSLTGES